MRTESVAIAQKSKHHEGQLAHLLSLFFKCTFTHLCCLDSLLENQLGFFFGLVFMIDTLTQFPEKEIVQQAPPV